MLVLGLLPPGELWAFRSPALAPSQPLTHDHPGEEPSTGAQGAEDGAWEVVMELGGRSDELSVFRIPDERWPHHVPSVGLSVLEIVGLAVHAKARLLLYGHLVAQSVVALSHRVAHMPSLSLLRTCYNGWAINGRGSSDA